MKILIVLILACCACVAEAQAGITLKGATQPNVTLSWQQPLPAGTWPGCTASFPCAYQVFVLRGQQCPQTVVGSPGWQYVGQTSALKLTDSTEAPGTIASYVAYTLQSGKQSDPSNCITVTIPPVPQSPTNLVQQ